MAVLGPSPGGLALGPLLLTTGLGGLWDEGGWRRLIKEGFLEGVGFAQCFEERGMLCHGKEKEGIQGHSNFCLVKEKDGWGTELLLCLRPCPEPFPTFSPFSTFADPSALRRLILWTRSLSSRQGRSLAAGHADGEQTGTPSPGQGIWGTSVDCPDPQAQWEFCFELPLGPPHQLSAAARATPVPGLATSQPKIPGLGAKAPEPVLPTSIAGHHHPSRFSHSEHTPPPDLVSGLLGPWEKKKKISPA